LQGDWFLTGDHVRHSGDGALHYLGRADELMTAGGFRVSPLEVEQALADMPGLNEVAVTEVEIRPDVRIIAAFYTSAQPIAEQALTAFAAQRLARYKQPRLYRRVPVLPRGANGKLSRRNLRAQFKADDDHA
jgi:acyl-coenzyme A synthetase/AMP-(fatty) acid ligase